MKKLLLILMLCVTSSYSLTARVWCSTSSTDMNNGNNYNPTGTLTTSDSLVFKDSTGITEVGPVATANLDIGAIHVVSGCPYNVSHSGYTVKLQSDYLVRGNGTHNYGKGFTLNGNNSLWNNNAVGGTTLSGCTLIVNGIWDTLYNQKVSNGIPKLVLNNGKKAYLKGGTTSFHIGFNLNANPPLIMNGNSRLFVNQSSTAVATKINNSVPFSLNYETDTLDGDALLYVGAYAANQTCTIPSFRYIGTGVTQLYNPANTVYYLPHKIKVSGNFTVRNSASTSTWSVFFGTDSVICNQFLWGAQNATANINKTYFSGAKILALGGVSQISTGIDTAYFDSSFWMVKGNWTYANPTGGDIIYVGKSVVKFYDGVNATVTTGNHTSGFYDFRDSVDAANKVSLGDSLTCAFLKLISGKFSSLTYNVSIDSGLYRTTPDSVNMGTGRYTFKGNNAMYYRRAGAAPSVTGGASIVGREGLYFDVDANLTFYNVKISPRKKLTLTSGYTFKDSTYSAGDLDTIAIVATGATRALFNVPANTSFRYDTLQRINFVNTVYDTFGPGTALNKGWNYNVWFKHDTASLGNYKADSTAPTISILSKTSGMAGDTVTITGTHFRGRDVVTFGGVTATILSKVDTTQITVIVPAGTGTVAVGDTNADKSYGEKSAAWTYAGGPTITAQPVSDPLSSGFKSAWRVTKAAFRSAWR